MKKYIVLLITLATCSFASEQDEAVNKSGDALLAHPKIQQYKKNSEENVDPYLRPVGGSKNAATVAMVAYSAQRGEVTTKHFKNLRYRDDGFDIRPEVVYNYRHNETRSSIVFSWEW